MKWVKICALVVLTLATMRAGSWAVAWLLSFVTVRVRVVAIAANLLAFLAFLLLLYLNLLPGEPIDLAALFFGLIVFAIYTVADSFWRPWRQKL